MEEQFSDHAVLYNNVYSMNLENKLFLINYETFKLE